MKKATLLLVAAASLLFAQSKTEMLSSDSTMKQSTRKAVMGIAELGLEAKKFTFPVFYTPHGKNAKTRHIGDWTVVVRESYMDNVLADNYPFLIPSRFDKLIFLDNTAIVLTATKMLKVDAKTKPFNYGTGALEDYQSSVLSYLNSQIAPKIKKVLAAASDARYSEMPSDEAESFIKNKAKEIGMPAEVLEALVNSSFAFGVYMEKMTGQINIRQVELIDATGHKI